MLDETRDIKIKELLRRHNVPKSVQQEAAAALSELFDDLTEQYEQAIEFWRKHTIARLEEENQKLRDRAAGDRKLANHLFEQVIQLQLEAARLNVGCEAGDEPAVMIK